MELHVLRTSRNSVRNKVKNKVFFVCSIAYWSLFVLVYIAYYPGLMSNDSKIQLHQAYNGLFSDWHPPVMAWIWSYLLESPFGVGGMLFFHLLMLYLSCFIFFLNKNNYYSLLFLAVPFLPWVFNFSVVIWKDVGLAYSWLLAIAIATYYSGRSVPIFAKLSIFLFISYGFLVRTNAPIAGFLVLPYILKCMYGDKLSYKFITIFSVVTVMLYATIITMSFKWIINAESKYGLQYVFYDDISYIVRNNQSAANKINFFDSKDIDNIKECKHLEPTENNYSRMGSYYYCIDKKITNDAEYKVLLKDWFRLLVENKALYFKYRMIAFFESLRIGKDSFYVMHLNYSKVPQGDFKNKYLVKKTELRFMKAYVAFFDANLSFIYKPYFWIIILFIYLYSLFKKADKLNSKYWLLPGSALLYCAGYLPFTQSYDFRYFYYPVLIATIVIVLELHSRNSWKESPKNETCNK